MLQESEVIMCSELLQTFSRKGTLVTCGCLIKIHLKCILYWVATVNNILKMYLGVTYRVKIKSCARNF